jgi:hypothetical protein
VSTRTTTQLVTHSFIPKKGQKKRKGWKGGGRLGAKQRKQRTPPSLLLRYCQTTYFYCTSLVPSLILPNPTLQVSTKKKGKKNKKKEQKNKTKTRKFQEREYPSDPLVECKTHLINYW